MKNLQFNPYQCGAGWGGDGRVGSKKSKPITDSLHGTGLKSLNPSLVPLEELLFV